MKKTAGDIIILHTCTKNYDQIIYCSWDMVHKWQMDRQTDRQMDGWKDGKSDIQRWVPHLKINISRYTCKDATVLFLKNKNKTKQTKDLSTYLGYFHWLLWDLGATDKCKNSGLGRTSWS